MREALCAAELTVLAQYLAVPSPLCGSFFLLIVLRPSIGIENVFRVIAIVPEALIGKPFAPAPATNDCPPRSFTLTPNHNAYKPPRQCPRASGDGRKVHAICRLMCFARARKLYSIQPKCLLATAPISFSRPPRPRGGPKCRDIIGGSEVRISFPSDRGDAPDLARGTVRFSPLGISTSYRAINCSISATHPT